MRRFVMQLNKYAAYCFCALAAIASAKADYISTVEADSPIGYWRLDETSGSVATNRISGGVSGAYVNASYLSYGKTGALTASGDNDAAVGLSGSGATKSGGDSTASYITMSSSALSSVGSGAFSIELWFNVNSTSTREDIFTEKFANELGIFITGGKLTVYDGTSYTGSAITTNTWYQLTMTRSSSGVLSIYLNGVLQSALTSTFIANFSSTSDVFYIGTNYNASLGNYFGFGGSIDELAFYNYALTSSQVSSHYTAAISAVPEPSAAILFGSGVLGLLAFAWRKR